MSTPRRSLLEGDDKLLFQQNCEIAQLKSKVATLTSENTFLRSELATTRSELATTRSDLAKLQEEFETLKRRMGSLSLGGNRNLPDRAPFDPPETICGKCGDAEHSTDYCTKK